MRKSTKDTLLSAMQWHQATFTHAALENLINALPTPITIAQQDSSVIMMANKAAVRLFNSKDSGLVGHNSLSIGLWPSPLLRSRMLRRVEEEGMLLGQPVTLIDASRRHITGLLSILPLSLDGHPSILFAFEPGAEANASAQAQVGDAERQAWRSDNDKMEAIAHCVAAIAHDFNNIHAALMLRVELLALEAQPGDMVGQAIDDLTTELRRATQFTRDLLMLSRREPGSRLAIELNEFVARTQETLGRLVCPQCRIDFAANPEPLWIEGDPPMLEQVLLHLVSNARDAMSSGGTIHLSLAPIKVTRSNPNMPADGAEGLHACLMVTDQGCGMDTRTRARLFEPFHSTKENEKRRGLGLALAYGIIRQHRGWIEVDTRLGRGTAFSLFFPIVTTPGRRHSRPAHVVAKQGGRILLIEDNPSVRRLAGLLLRQRGHEVIEASTSSEGLRLWQQQADTISLALVALFLPDGYLGLDLIAELHASHPQLPVLLLSGYDLRAAEAPNLPPHCRFLAKPFDSRTLLEAVSTSLSHSSP